MRAEKSNRLNTRQKIFCEAYITSGNAYKSALAAGYSPATAKGSMGNLLNKPIVKQYIEKRQQELVQTMVDTNEVIEQLKAIAFFDIDEVAVVEDGVLIVRDTKAMGKHKRAAIASLRQGPKGVEIKPYDKMKALAMLTQITGKQNLKNTETEEKEGTGVLKVEIVVVDK